MYTTRMMNWDFYKLEHLEKLKNNTFHAYPKVP